MHTVIQIGQKYNPRGSGLIFTVHNIYLFRNAANGCWGTFVTTAYEGTVQGDVLMDKFVAAIDAGEIILVEMESQKKDKNPPANEK